MRRILVLGGYGTFGARAAERLAREGGIELIIAGRSLAAAEAHAAALAKTGRAKIAPARLDASALTAGELAALRPDVLINASGPYQTQGYGVARACIEAGVHYIDLADARAFVTGISALDGEARRAGVLVVGGASTVPALSAAVTDAHVAQFATLTAVTTVIAPANSFDPGLATTQSILGTVGRPIVLPKGNATATGYGWQGLRRVVLPGLGRRWLGLVDVPDLDLFPRRYPSSTIRRSVCRPRNSRLPPRAVEPVVAGARRRRPQPGGVGAPPAGGKARVALAWHGDGRHDGDARGQRRARESPSASSGIWSPGRATGRTFPPSRR